VVGSFLFQQRLDESRHKLLKTTSLALPTRLCVVLLPEVLERLLKA